MAVRENYSRKRVAILETLCDTSVHPTAEWVYEKLKTQYSDLSLGTVYRNIKKFCSENKVKSVGVFGGQEHFDGNMTPHSHFVCSHCGAVLDIGKAFFSLEELGALSEEYGISIQNEDVIFRGTCNTCSVQNGAQ